MKSTLLLFVCFALSIASYAQKPDKTDVKFKIDFFPKEIISKEKLVNIAVSSNYQDLIAEREAEIQAMNDEIQAIKDEKANRSTTEKVANLFLGGGNEKKAPDPSTIYVPRLIGEETTAAFNIPGYTENNEVKGKVEIVFSPMNASGISASSFSYKPLLANVTVTNDKGQKCYEGVLGATSTNMTYLKGFDSWSEAYRKAEENAKNETVKVINKYLTDNFAYTTHSGERRFYDIKDKKQQYPEYHTAIEKVKMAFAYFSVPSKAAAKNEALKEAITIWENALKDLDKNDKNARISKEVAAVTYLNIAEAYIWLNEFDKSREALAECILVDDDYTKESNKVTSFLNLYSERYNKYMSY